MLLAATLSLPMAALAQNPAAPPKQTGHSDMARHTRQTMPDRVEQRIADLHARLHITPDQQAQWDKFAQVMRDNAQKMHQTVEDRATKIKSMNASDNMLSYAQIATQHAQDLQNLAAAFQPLYTSLSKDQQQTADAMFRDVGIRHRPNRRPR
jgi:protein CpxP